MKSDIDQSEASALLSTSESNSNQSMTDAQMQKLVCACLICASLTLAFSAIGYFGGNAATVQCIPGAIKPGTCGPMSPEITTAQIWSPCGSGNPFRSACFSLIWGSFSLFGAGAGIAAANSHLKPDETPTNASPINI